MNIIDTIRSWFYSTEPCYHATDTQEASQDTGKKPVNKCCQGEFECWSEPISTEHNRDINDVDSCFPPFDKATVEVVDNIVTVKTQTKQPFKFLVRNAASKTARDIGKNLRNVFRS